MGIQKEETISNTEPRRITQLLKRWRDDEDAVREALMPAVYDQLRRIAARQFAADILVGQEYPVRIEYREDLGGPLLTVDVGGQAMCPIPGPGVEPCVPYDPDPDDPSSTPIVGSGVVGLGVEGTGASFNRLRVIRSDELPFPLSVLFSDGFEAR